MFALWTTTNTIWSKYVYPQVFIDNYLEHHRKIYLGRLAYICSDYNYADEDKIRYENKY